MFKTPEAEIPACPLSCPSCKTDRSTNVVNIWDYHSYVRCAACGYVWSVPTHSLEPALKKGAPRHF